MHREDPKESPGSFEGLLLVAHPSLKDPNFRRSVLFLSQHEETVGAFGLVINRPLGKTAADLLPEHDQHSILEQVPVYLGGPVGCNQLGFVELDWDGAGKQIHLETNLSMEQVTERVEKQPGSVRAFVGYAGWSAGQLEGELSQKAWVLTKPRRESTKRENEAKLWLKIMGSLGPAYKLLAAAPDDPSLN